MPRATGKSPKTRTTPYDVAEHLRTPEEMAAYLDAWLEEAPDGDVPKPVERGRMTAPHS
jgi:DNA-binding phage protein